MTFAVGVLGFFLFRLLHIPNPALLGSMVATGALNIAGFYPSFSSGTVSFVANAAIGLMLGRQIDRNVVRRIRELCGYVAAMGVCMIALSLVSGYALYRMTDIPLATALVASSAGGITEMVAFGMSVNADIAVVAFVQLFRVVTFLALIPCLSLVSGKPNSKPEGAARSAAMRERFSPKQYVALIAATFAGAALANRAGVPTGAMLGAMVAGGACVLATGRTYGYDPKVRYAAQIALGLIMGQRMTPVIVSRIGQLFLPAAIATVVMLVGSVALALLLRRASTWDLVTCLLCAAPAGLSQITVYAEEIGADSFTASVFHTVRILGIVSIYPWIVLAVL